MSVGGLDKEGRCVSLGGRDTDLRLREEEYGYRCRHFKKPENTVAWRKQGVCEDRVHATLISVS